MSCVFTNTEWDDKCKDYVKNEISIAISGYSLTTSQLNCVCDKLFKDYTPVTYYRNTEVVKNVISKYIPDCKSSSGGHTVLIIIIVLIILGVIAGTVFYLKSKGVIKF